MNIGNRLKVLPFFLITAYLLAACGGALPASDTSARVPKVDANVVAFTGVVEAINGTQWIVSGQTLTLDPQASLDPNITVGDEVKVEANVMAEGAVVALKVESSKADEVLSTPSAATNSTPDASSTPDAVASPAAGTNGNEVFGTIEAMTADSLTVNGVTYSLTNLARLKDIVTIGDQVKLHVTVNTDGTLTIRELTKFTASLSDNSSTGGSDDGPNHDRNDDHSNCNCSGDGPNHDGNDDHGGGDRNSGSGGND